MEDIRSDVMFWTVTCHDRNTLCKLEVTVFADAHWHSGGREPAFGEKLEELRSSRVLPDDQGSRTIHPRIMFDQTRSLESLCK